mmetsp:Transcript_37724/g.91790  ORF Transcript_37724/g.91790 Transcript_37724/m.91790 type:complete len:507 (-) Transcript_37724:365-1885(-)
MGVDTEAPRVLAPREPHVDADETQPRKAHGVPLPVRVHGALDANNLHPRVRLDLLQARLDVGYCLKVESLAHHVQHQRHIPPIRHVQLFHAARHRLYPPERKLAAPLPVTVPLGKASPPPAVGRGLRPQLELAFEHLREANDPLGKHVVHQESLRVKLVQAAHGRRRQGDGGARRPGADEVVEALALQHTGCKVGPGALGDAPRVDIHVVVDEEVEDGAEGPGEGAGGGGGAGEAGRVRREHRGHLIRALGWGRRQPQRGRNDNGAGALQRYIPRRARRKLSHLLQLGIAGVLAQDIVEQHPVKRPAGHPPCDLDGRTGGSPALDAPNHNLQPVKLKLPIRHNRLPRGVVRQPPRLHANDRPPEVLDPEEGDDGTNGNPRKAGWHVTRRGGEGDEAPKELLVEGDLQQDADAATDEEEDLKRLLEKGNNRKARHAGQRPHHRVDRQRVPVGASAGFHPRLSHEEEHGADEAHDNLEAEGEEEGRLDQLRLSKVGEEHRNEEEHVLG